MTLTSAQRRRGSGTCGKKPSPQLRFIKKLTRAVVLSKFCVCSRLPASQSNSSPLKRIPIYLRRGVVAASPTILGRVQTVSKQAFRTLSFPQRYATHRNKDKENEKETEKKKEQHSRHKAKCRISTKRAHSPGVRPPPPRGPAS